MHAGDYVTVTLFSICVPLGCTQTVAPIQHIWHEKFRWKAEVYFDDPQVIAL